MKILIAGSDLNAKLLAQYIKMENKSHDIYITTEEPDNNNTYTPINIKEMDVNSICDFVKYNQIEFTIVTSSIAIINGIADEFKKEGFPIFAPLSESARITYFNSIAKKIMYKLKINTPKFGIFDRENLAVDYIRKIKFPIAVENDFILLHRENYVYKTFSQAKIGIQKIFENNNEKIVIENHIDETPIYLYFITDGYNAMPLISLSREDNTNYTTMTAPSDKISENLIINILRQVIYPLLDDIIKYADAYSGILGIKIKLHKNNFYVYEFYNKFQDYDFQAFLSLFDDNLVNILFDCANGCLADNRDFIRLTDKYSFSIAINKNEILNDDDECNDFIISEDTNKYIYTAIGCTINNSKKILTDYMQNITSKDIINSLTDSLKEKELKY